MLLSSFFTRSMVFAHLLKAQLPFILFSETFLTIRQNSLYVTVCIIARTFYQGYFIHSLSTLYYYNAPSLATRLTGDYRDRTCTGECGPASLDTQQENRSVAFCNAPLLCTNYRPSNCFFFASNSSCEITPMSSSSLNFLSSSAAETAGAPLTSTTSLFL